MLEKTILYVKNFPKQFSNLDKTEFLQVFGALEVKSLGKNAFAKFNNELQSNDALHKLHQYELMGKVLSAEYTRKPEDNFEISFDKYREDVSENKKKDFENFSEYVKKLYAINSELNCNQSPLHLGKQFPSVNRDIIDGIGILLETNQMFYTQVFHLMNKMSLPLPVAPVHREEKIFCSSEVQTDLTLLDEESEMESEGDEQRVENFIPEIRKRKSFLPIKRSSKKFRSILEAEKNKLQSEDGHKTIANPKEVFTESNFVDPERRKITIQVPTEIVSTKLADAIVQEEEPPKSDEEQILKTITEIELKENRLNPNQLQDIPVFKDYQAGSKSNKLYLKNLSKNVVEEDLRRIFNLFIKHKTEEIEIKLMQTGRMKGQAFITFSTPYQAEDIEEGKETMVEKALRLTNGFILKDKPMVVMFGKSSVEWGK